MKLSECNIGTVVKTIYNPDEKKVGHIIALTLSDADQVVVVVRWANGEETAVHAYNLVSLRDYDSGI